MRLVAERVEQVLKGQPLPAIEHQPVEPPAKAPAKPEPKPAKKSPVRSDALNLLESLQREARLIDFLQESLAGYDDAQVGAAVRDLHRQSAAVLERMFALKPIETAPEGATTEVGEGFDPGRIHLAAISTARRPSAASSATTAGKPPAATCPPGTATTTRST